LIFFATRARRPSRRLNRSIRFGCPQKGSRAQLRPGERLFIAAEGWAVPAFDPPAIPRPLFAAQGDPAYFPMPRDNRMGSR
jgi:hypothetical protein